MYRLHLPCRAQILHESNVFWQKAVYCFVLRSPYAENSPAPYDIDHQDEVKKFEGKKVRVKGTLDASNKIHVQ